MKMFELATDFSKRTVYPPFLFIDPSQDYEESQKQATRYIKTLICRNIEIPNKEPNMGYDGLEWKINPTVIKQILYIINNIDVRHWKCIGYSSLRNVGTYTWEETFYGEYHITLLKNVIFRMMKEFYLVIYILAFIQILYLYYVQLPIDLQKK